MSVKTREQLVAKIHELEIAIGKLEHEQGGTYGDQFPKILKLIRKMQRLREKL